MAETPQQSDLGADFDLDEDLFNFDEIAPDVAEHAEDDLDLEEIFAAFQDMDTEDDGDGEQGAPEEIGAEAPPPQPAAAACPTPAPAAPPAFPAPSAFAPPQPGSPDPLDRMYGAPASGAPLAGGRASGPLVPGVIGKGVVMVVIAMTLLNAVIALYTFKNSSDMRDDLNEAAREMSETAADIRLGVEEQAQAVTSSFMPVVPPEPENHATFDRALADIETGNFAKARERVYALLAVVDRMPPESRHDVESRAAYLLAKSYHAEAVAREASP